MKDFAKSIRTMNSNKEEIIQKKKEQGATLKVDNGQKLEFSDGTTYVKTSFSDDYREAHNHVGNAYRWEEMHGHQEFYNPAVPFGGHSKGFVEKSNNGYIGAKANGSIVISQKEFATEEEAKRYVETGNKKVGNAWTLVDEKRLNELLKKGPSKMTDEEWKEFQELNKRADQENAKALKKLGNSKVGNSAYDDMREAKNIADSIQGRVKREGLTPEVKNWANIEIGKINQIADYLENSAKSVRDEANKMKQIVK